MRYTYIQSHKDTLNTITHQSTSQFNNPILLANVCHDNKILEATSFLDKKFMRPYSLGGSSSRLGIYIDLASERATDGSGGTNVEGGTHGKPRSREVCGDTNCSFPSNPCTELVKPHESSLPKDTPSDLRTPLQPARRSTTSQ